MNVKEILDQLDVHAIDESIADCEATLAGLKALRKVAIARAGGADDDGADVARKRKPTVKQPTEEVCKAIVDFLRKHGPATKMEIVTATNIHHLTIKSALNAGPFIERAGGKREAVKT